MDPNLFFAAILILSSSFTVCFSENPNGDMQQLGGLLQGGGGGGGGGNPHDLSALLQQQSVAGGGLPMPIGNPDQLACMNKVAPCQSFLHATTTPPPTCCDPLLKMLENDTKCLCQIFDNPQTMKQLNITKEDALNLPKACGAKDVDISVCENVSSASNSTTTPAGASNGTTTGGSNSTTEGSNSTDSTAGATSLSYLGASGFIALFISLFL
ncbi:hypothetical protein ACFE04_010905 [Oxalis oulophora]